MSALSPSAKMNALTGVRACAAFWVLLLHLDWAAPYNVPILLKLERNGYVAVGLFFMLSGFVLTEAYRSKCTGEFWKRAALSRFFGRRFARIYPLYIVSVLFAACYQWSAHGKELLPKLGQLAVQALGIHSWIPTFGNWFNFPSWSISCELFFYALFPWLLVCLSRFSNRKTLLLLSAALALLPGILSLVISRTPDIEWLLLRNPLARLPEFILGCSLSIVWAERSEIRLGFVERYGFFIGVVGSVAAILFLGKVDSSTPDVILLNSVITLPFCFVLVGLASNKGRSSVYLGTPAMLVLGEASYALYLMQEPMLRMLTGPLSMLGMNGVTVTGWLLRLAIIALLWGYSYCAWRYFERPVQQWINRKVDARVSKRKRIPDITVKSNVSVGWLKFKGWR